MSTAIDELVANIREEAHRRFRRYEGFAQEVEQAGYPQAAKLLRAILLSERARLRLYRECLTALNDSRQVFAYYICPHCGLVLSKEAPERCLLCDTAGDRFTKVS